MMTCNRVRARDIPTYATPRCQSDSMSVRPATMMTSFSRPLKPETVDQVMLCRVAVPRWGTSSSVKKAVDFLARGGD